MDKKTFLFYLLMGYTLPGFSLMDINYGFEEDPQEAIGKASKTSFKKTRRIRKSKVEVLPQDQQPPADSSLKSQFTKQLNAVFNNQNVNEEVEDILENSLENAKRNILKIIKEAEKTAQSKGKISSESGVSSPESKSIMGTEFSSNIPYKLTARTENLQKHSDTPSKKNKDQWKSFGGAIKSLKSVKNYIQEKGKSAVNWLVTHQDIKKDENKVGNFSQDIDEGVNSNNKKPVYTTKKKPRMDTKSKAKIHPENAALSEPKKISTATKFKPTETAKETPGVDKDGVAHYPKFDT